ncbi:MAG: hypothetical protein H7338_10145 [Candidatus Sericytochromatia bacterium]|nr:hypothetical protein [Candidatus Sericytochromatia bacterium]
MTEPQTDRDPATDTVTLMSKTQLVSLLHVGASRPYRGLHFTPQIYRAIAHTMRVLQMEQDLPDWIDEWHSPTTYLTADQSPSVRLSSRPSVN